jgi:hypothetical protein
MMVQGNKDAFNWTDDSFWVVGISFDRLKFIIQINPCPPVNLSVLTFLFTCSHNIFFIWMREIMCQQRLCISPNLESLNLLQTQGNDPKLSPITQTTLRLKFYHLMIDVCWIIWIASYFKFCYWRAQTFKTLKILGS